MQNVHDASLRTPSIDDPENVYFLRSLIQKKPGLKEFYRRCYLSYQREVAASTPGGKVLEVGSGAGFVKDVIPQTITSDFLQYDGLDMRVDATALPFENNSLSTICMLNVFHHIPDVEKFFHEAQRALLPGGRVVIVDQNPGIFGYPILKYVHHEPFVPQAQTWTFASTGPLSGANGALAWIVFQRDRAKFESMFPDLKIVSYRRHSPLFYWMAGGLKNWSLLPRALFPVVDLVEKFLLFVSPDFGCFVNIVLEKKR